MPRTYQVNDYPGFYRNDVPSDFAVRRSGHSLPENRVVLANFNQLYKIDPQTLSLWAQILHSCASCVMWLLAFPYHAKSNMLRVSGFFSRKLVLDLFLTFATGTSIAKCF
jgi:protein O-GlcNAc transferase